VIRHLSVALLVAVPALAEDKPPTASDPRLVVELFAAAPDIVQPIAMDFDSKGRLLVVESHTHFRPAKYTGPKFDRIRMFEDTKGTGKADKITTFFEGTTHTMDLAVHPDGSVYIATRNEILRLRDTKGTGVADEKTQIARLETAGNYPHNGLSGLSFDFHGDLNFGIGENLGADYKLIGSDGTTLTGGGEGGNVFHCTADGKALRRVATGFWNPFGSCRDIFGRLWVVDNDPDESPPCRLVHVVEGGDYGFQFRYGRAGRHVFQAWNGELPGTLPYAAGTGESPTEVIAYESDGLPKEYLGNLLVPVWADHRVERYVVQPRGASFSAERKPFVQGGREFRPSGMAIAPDGSVFVSDWVSQSYELHGKGAIWHVRMKDAKPAPRPTDPEVAITSLDRKTREAAARELAGPFEGKELLRKKLTSSDVRIRTTALAALVEHDPASADSADVKKFATDMKKFAMEDPETGIGEMAVRAMVGRARLGQADQVVAELKAIAMNKKVRGRVRAEAVAAFGGKDGPPTPEALLKDDDPYLKQAAIHRVAQESWRLRDLVIAARTDPALGTGVVLACRSSGETGALNYLVDFLAEPDPDARFLAIKWVSDEKLSQFRPQIAEMMTRSTLDPREFQGLATCLARLDNKPVDPDNLAAYFLDRLTDDKAPLASRLMALKAIPANSKRLKVEQLIDWLKINDPAFRVEVLRAIKDRPDAKAAAAVSELVADPQQPAGLRAQGLVTLAAINKVDPFQAIDLAAEKDIGLRQEALRSLVQVPLTNEQKARLNTVPEKDLVARLLGKPFFEKRPALTETDAWLKRLEGPADPEAGRRVFEHPKLAGCAKCHRVEGRGADIGPDLSLIGRTDRKWIVESILQPSAVVAPHYQPWKVDTVDGKSRVGLLVGTHLDESVYVDAKGDVFKVLAGDVADAVPTKGSIMPDNLVDVLTDQEFRDLVAFLAARK
jgi:putative membrane-bound dehydrogenase-like protein